MLLSYLPEEFENCHVVIESRGDISEICVIKTKLIEEDTRRRSNDNEKSVALYSRPLNVHKKKKHMKNIHSNIQYIVSSREMLQMWQSRASRVSL